MGTGAAFDVLTLHRHHDEAATIYFEEDVHKALRLKAAETDQSISDLVNDAVVKALADDAADLDEFRDRAGEPTGRFEDFVADMKRRGRL